MIHMHPAFPHETVCICIVNFRHVKAQEFNSLAHLLIEKHAGEPSKQLFFCRV